MSQALWFMVLISLQAIAAVLKSLSWKSFTVIYDSDDGLTRIQDVLQLHGPQDSPITIRQLEEGTDYLPLLKEIANSTDWNLLLDLNPTNLVKVLKEGKKFKMLRDYYKYFITYLVSHTIRIIVKTVQAKGLIHDRSIRLFLPLWSLLSTGSQNAACL